VCFVSLIENLKLSKGMLFQMRFILLFLQVSFILSCSHMSQKPLKSTWSRLGEARPVSCNSWPIKEKHLDLSEIAIAGEWNFLLSGRTRDGITYQERMSLKAFKPDLDSQRALNWGFGSEYLGTWTEGDKRMVLLASFRDEAFHTLQVRDLDSNALYYESEKLEKNMVPLEFFKEKNGFWLGFKIVEAEASLDEKPLHFARFQFKSPRKIVLTQKLASSIRGEYKFVNSRTQNLLGVYYKRGSEKGEFNRIALNSKGTGLIERKLDIKVQERVESWDVSESPFVVSLSVVEGDSLLWEKSRLNIALLDESFSLLRSQVFEISNEHVGEPRLLSTQSNTYLFLPKWLDYESSLEVYKISSVSVESLGLYGLFEEGTYFDQVLYNGAEEEFVILNQSPSSRLRGFSYCKLEL